MFVYLNKKGCGLLIKEAKECLVIHIKICSFSVCYIEDVDKRVGSLLYLMYGGLVFACIIVVD